MSLAFLKEIKVEETVVPKRAGGGSRKQWNPTTANTIRIWKDGSVFPSADLVERFSLEYGNKPAEAAEGEKKEKISGNAFDVFSSENFPTLKTPQAVILMNVAARAAGKTDLFGSTGYNEDGTPKSSVMDQGSKTFGKEDFLPMIETVYSQTPNEDGYIDMILVGTDGEAATQPFTIPGEKKICYVPKAITRGEKAGEVSTVRRENPVLFILYPAVLLQPAVTELNAGQKKTEAQQVGETATV